MKNRWFCSLIASVVFLAPACFAAQIAPKIAAVAPSPKNWIVNGASLASVRITIDEVVSVPTGAVQVRSISSGVIPSTFVVSQVSGKTFLDVSFAPARFQRITVVVDYTVVDAKGRALDGESGDPMNPVFPTGDDRQGGAAIFQFTVQPGDVNRDGGTNVVDSSLVACSITATCAGPGIINGVHPNADLNKDGVVNSADSAIVVTGFQGSVPATDGEGPKVSSQAPTVLPFPGNALVVQFTEAVDPETVGRTSVFGVAANGAMILPAAAPTAVNGRTFRFSFPIECLGDYDFFISGAVADVSGALLDTGAPHCNCSFTAIGSDAVPPEITCPEALYVNSTQPFKIAADHYSGAQPQRPEILMFLTGASAFDPCEGVIDAVSAALENPSGDWINPLTDPIDLDLGLHFAEFTATDAAGNIAVCQAPLIVVPAVPIYCWDLNLNGLGDVDNEDFNRDQVVDILDCRGASGPQGPQGNQGESGLPGAAGPAGPEGQQGPQGAQGSQGPQGAQGPQGPQGASGTGTGIPGPTGPAGPAGSSGSTGSAGSAGAQGLAGEAGQDGAQGPAGAQGEVGATGEQGPPGPQGLQGEAAEPTAGQAVPAADEPPVDAPADAGRACGALGMIILMFMFACLGSARLLRVRA